MSNPLESESVAEFEADMEAVSTVYALRAGAILTEKDIQALQRFDAVARRDQERAVDAFHRGYQSGISRASNKDVSTLIGTVDKLNVELMCERAMRKFDFDRGASEMQDKVSHVILNQISKCDNPGVIALACIDILKELETAVSAIPLPFVDISEDVSEALSTTQ